MAAAQRGEGDYAKERADAVGARSSAPASPETSLAGLAGPPSPERQLTLDDALAAQAAEHEYPETIATLEAGDRPSARTLERLGESEAFANVILALLKRNGWAIVSLPYPFAGEGVALAAICSWAEVHGVGETLAAATRELLGEVSTYFGVKQARPTC